MIKVLFIGPAPQNIGGISMHIRRLVNLLRTDIKPDLIDEGHVRYPDVFNLRSKNLFIYFSKIVKADVVHIHSGVWLLRAFHIIVCKLILRKYTIVTIHRDPTIERCINLTRWLLKICNHVILVNQKGYEAMRCSCKCQFHMLPAFIPPVINEEPLMPPQITAWISEAKQHENSIVMCSNAWNLVLHNGQDLYGLDICIEAMNELMKVHNNYFLIFVVASNTGQVERIKGYKQKIVDYKLEHNILIWEDSISFVRLIQESDCVLRTTNTDGDAISVREALYYGKPVIASDIVTRPAGTVLFKCRDVIDLVRRITEIEIFTKEHIQEKQFDYRQQYLSIYHKKI